MAESLKDWLRARELQRVDTVQLVQEYHEGNLFPYWVLEAPGTYNHAYYGDMFRTKAWASERAQWLEQNIGPGGRTAGRHPYQKWFLFEDVILTPEEIAGNDSYRTTTRLIRTRSDIYRKTVAAVCFKNENDALLFKLRWTE